MSTIGKKGQLDEYYKFIYKTSIVLKDFNYISYILSA